MYPENIIPSSFRDPWRDPAVRAAHQFSDANSLGLGIGVGPVEGRGGSGAPFGSRRDSAGLLRQLWRQRRVARAGGSGGTQAAVGCAAGYGKARQEVGGSAACRERALIGTASGGEVESGWGRGGRDGRIERRAGLLATESWKAITPHFGETCNLEKHSTAKMRSKSNLSDRRFFSKGHSQSALPVEEALLINLDYLRGPKKILTSKRSP